MYKLWRCYYFDNLLAELFKSFVFRLKLLQYLFCPKSYFNLVFMFKFAFG